MMILKKSNYWKFILAILLVIILGISLFFISRPSKQDLEDAALIRQTKLLKKMVEGLNIQAAEFKKKEEASCHGLLNLDLLITETCILRNKDIHVIDYAGVNKCFEKQKVWVPVPIIEDCIEQPYASKKTNTQEIIDCFFYSCP